MDDTSTAFCLTHTCAFLFFFSPCATHLSGLTASRVFRCRLPALRSCWMHDGGGERGGWSFCLHALYNTHQCNAMRQNIYTACMLITPVPLHRVAYSQPPTLSGSGNSCIHLCAHMDECNGCHAAASPPPTLPYPPTRRNPTEPELRHLLSPRC